MIVRAMFVTAVAVRVSTMRLTVVCFRELRFVAVFVSVMRDADGCNELVRFWNVAGRFKKIVRGAKRKRLLFATQPLRCHSHGGCRRGSPRHSFAVRKIKPEDWRHSGFEDTQLDETRFNRQKRATMRTMFNGGTFRTCLSAHETIGP